MHLTHGEKSYQQNGDPVVDHTECFGGACDDVECEQNEERCIAPVELHVVVEPALNNAGILVRRGLLLDC